jgi:hypothetical protein
MLQARQSEYRLMEAMEVAHFENLGTENERWTLHSPGKAESMVRHRASPTFYQGTTFLVKIRLWHCAPGAGVKATHEEALSFSFSLQTDGACWVVEVATTRDLALENLQ